MKLIQVAPIYTLLFFQLSEKCSLATLSSFSKEGFKKTPLYWKNMNQYINEITDKVKTQPV